MITNLNNKGLIKPFLKYGVLSVLMAVGLLAGAFTVSASDNVSCYDIVRQGMDVDYNGTGVFNSGKPIFDEIVAGAPQYAYQGCLEDGALVGFADAANVNFGAPGNPYWQVKGWAWNDNLGWISMYCKAGMNLGVACGPFNYGVTIDDQGYLHGYAWGDNTGWISFDNSPHSRIKIDVDEPVCQGYVYGPTSNPDPSLCPAHTKQQTMAWSDNVGWMDFDGVIFPWFQVTKMLTDAEVIVELIPDPNGKFKTAATIDGKPPLANDNVTGTDNYTVKVTIRDKDGLLLEEPRYQTTIDMMWAVDTVKMDQRKPAVAATHNLAAVPVCTPHANRAVTKPCTFTTANEYTGGGIWEGIIRSLAPTSNMNRLIRAGDSSAGEPPDVTEFEYEKFIAPANLSTPALELNTLILREAQISVLDTANGLCLYGNDIITCSQRSRGFNDPAILSAEMKFLPQTEITTLTEDVNGNFIDVIVNEARSFTMQGSRKPGATVTLFGGWATTIANYLNDPLNFVFDTNGDGELVWGVDPVQLEVGGSLTGALTSFIAGIAQKSETTVSQFLKGLYIYSVVDEGNGVYYYSNKLPRVIGSTGVQPVAILRGSVYSVGAVTTTTTQGDPVRSLGDISTNLLRDQVFRNVSSLIAGASAQPANNLRLVKGQGLLNGGFEPGEGSGIVYLLNDSADVPKVYFTKGDIHVGRIGDTVEWSGERTIVTIGGNIYVDADLYNAVASPRPKLGLIALKDLTSNSSAAQGHVYILNTVNNVQANIFADGSVFTYDSGAAFNPADGRPVYADEDAYRDISEKHQLFIEGSVASQNTIGGATRQPRVDGLGKTVTDVLRAKQYDLNFLRMYTGLINRDASGNALTGGDPILGDPPVLVASEAALKITTAAGLPWSRHMIPAGDLYPPFELNTDFVPALGLEELSDLGSTYIYYDPPSPTLPGFQGGSEFDISVTAG